MPKRLHEGGPATSDAPAPHSGSRGLNPEHMKAFLQTNAGKEYSSKLDAHEKKRHEAYESARKAIKGKHPKRV